MQAVDAARAAAAEVNFFQSAAWPAEAADGPWRPQQQQQQQQQQQPVAVGRLVCFATVDAFFFLVRALWRGAVFYHACGCWLLAAQMVVVPETYPGQLPPRAPENPHQQQPPRARCRRRRASNAASRPHALVPHLLTAACIVCELRRRDRRHDGWWHDGWRRDRRRRDGRRDDRRRCDRQRVRHDRQLAARPPRPAPSPLTLTRIYTLPLHSHCRHPHPHPHRHAHPRPHPHPLTLTLSSRSRSPAPTHVVPLSSPHTHLHSAHHV